MDVLQNKKKISFSSLSPYLANSIKEIWRRDNIKYRYRIDNRNNYILYTVSGNKIKKLLNYFEKRTKKWNLLMWLYKSDFESSEISYEEDFSSIIDILHLLKKIKASDSKFLMTKFTCSHTTIRAKLKLLKLKKLIRLSNHPNEVTKYVSENTMVFLKKRFHNFLFNQIKNIFGKYDKFALFLEVHKATVSAWKVKKSRIPLKVVKNVCDIIDIPFSKALKNIYETDREIAEII